MLHGKPPYYDTTKEKLFRNILTAKVIFNENISK
jgi:hypothetical protein